MALGRLGRALAAALVLAASLGGAAAADEPVWVWPVAGEPAVARGFDPPEVRYAAGHRGADLASTPGAEVVAAGAGRVSYAGLLAGRGVVVVVHGDLRTTYEPVTAEVRVGAAVSAGQLLGRLEAGHAGCPVAACLHWGLRRGDTYLDPVQLVQRGPVRLLPLGAPRAGSSRSEPAAAVETLRAEPPTDAGPARPGPPPPLEEPTWSLRAAEAPLGAAAVAALVLGLGLLARPRPLPPAPAGAGSTAGYAAQADDPAARPAALLDLDEARARRRAAS